MSVLEFFVFDPLTKYLSFQREVESIEQAKRWAKTYNQTVMFAVYAYSHQETRKHKRFDDVKYLNDDPVDILKLVEVWNGDNCTINCNAPKSFYRFNPMYALRSKDNSIEIREPLKWEIEYEL